MMAVWLEWFRYRGSIDEQEQTNKNVLTEKKTFPHGA